MKKTRLIKHISIASVLVMFACTKFIPEGPDPDEVMDAPLDGLTYEQSKLFLAGAEEFDENYTPETGLGPIFVATACASCHTADSKGHPSTALTRFGQSDTLGNQFLNMGGPQIQQFAISGHTGETIPQGATSSVFIAPIVSGVGFLELVPDADILALADPNDDNSDGISGVPSWRSIPSWVVPSTNAITQNGKHICRFGRKASAYNLHHQTVGAFNNDMGITSSFLPMDPYNPADGLTSVPTASQEVSDASINAVVFYLQALQAPIQRNQNDPDVIAGKQIFNDIQCAACHTPKLKTGNSPIAALNNVEFYPYTDLLLHDMGAELDDHYTEGQALTSEWRTTPLWGLGLSADAQGGFIYLLHDGRAQSYEEAIQFHGGEGSNSRALYNQLSETEKSKLIKFLESL